jgi:hypothetical protein
MLLLVRGTAVDPALPQTAAWLLLVTETAAAAAAAHFKQDTVLLVYSLLIGSAVLLSNSAAAISHLQQWVAAFTAHLCGSIQHAQPPIATQLVYRFPANIMLLLSAVVKHI